MKKSYLVLLVFLLAGLYSCEKTETKQETASVSDAGKAYTKLSAKAFDSQLKTEKDPVIVDVRTPKEFQDGHIDRARNINIQDANFKSEIENLDKSAPVYVYCLSGGRSSDAASQMQAAGFKNIYELDGGMMKWRSENLPEISNKTIAQKGMTKQDFEKLTASQKVVLIDFYADWCAPCKKMEPYLTEMAKTDADKVKVVRINVDENKNLIKELKVDALPVLQVYKDGKMTWQNIGFTPKETVMQQIN